MIYHAFINENNSDVEYPSSSSGPVQLLAPVLGARKDGTANTNSSRGLLLTLLGEFALHHGGSAWTQTLVVALGNLGVEEKAARQAISRLAERDWLDKDKIGRRTRWSLTPELRGLLEEGAARIYGFGQSPPSWDGDWLLITASVPKRDRRVRYRLTSGLNWAGFGTLGQGWWISPRPNREAEARRVLGEAGIGNAHSFVAHHGSMGDPKELANRAWDLQSVRADYEAFLSEADALSDTGLDVDGGTIENDAQSASKLIKLVHEWRRFPFLDPDLPVQLLPPDWPGRAASERYRQLNDLWSPSAHHWWQSSEDHLSR